MRILSISNDYSAKQQCLVEIKFLGDDKLCKIIWNWRGETTRERHTFFPRWKCQICFWVCSVCDNRNQSDSLRQLFNFTFIWFIRQALIHHFPLLVASNYSRLFLFCCFSIQRRNCDAMCERQGDTINGRQMQLKMLVSNVPAAQRRMKNGLMTRLLCHQIVPSISMIERVPVSRPHSTSILLSPNERLWTLSTMASLPRRIEDIQMKWNWTTFLKNEESTQTRCMTFQTTPIWLPPTRLHSMDRHTVGMFLLQIWNSISSFLLLRPNNAFAAVVRRH